MSSKAWFLHVEGEALGPFSVSMLTKMITQGKATITDFVWCEGLPQWTLIAACEDFAAVLPEAPSTPLPNEEAEAAPAPKPVAKAKPAPVKAKVVVEEPAEEAAVEEEAEEAPAAPPKPAAKPAAKPVAVKPAPVKPIAKPKVMVRVWSKPIDAKVCVNGGKPLKVLDLTETGLIFEHTAAGAEMGADVKLRIESPSFAKAMELTAVVTRDEAFEGKPALGVEFTRMNPAHRRTLAQYISERMEDQAA